MGNDKDIEVISIDIDAGIDDLPELPELNDIPYDYDYDDYIYEYQNYINSEKEENFQYYLNLFKNNEFTDETFLDLQLCLIFGNIEPKHFDNYFRYICEYIGRYIKNEKNLSIDFYTILTERCNLLKDRDCCDKIIENVKDENGAILAHPIIKYIIRNKLCSEENQRYKIPENKNDDIFDYF